MEHGVRIVGTGQWGHFFLFFKNIFWRWQHDAMIFRLSFIKKKYCMICPLLLLVAFASCRCPSPLPVHVASRHTFLLLISLSASFLHVKIKTFWQERGKGSGQWGIFFLLSFVKSFLWRWNREAFFSGYLLSEFFWWRWNNVVFFGLLSTLGWDSVAIFFWFSFSHHP